MPTLGGAVCIRNGEELDFCWKEAVESLLPVCDEVVICDGESTDGTQEEARAWAANNPKIKICVWPWPDPKGYIRFWVDWLNHARQHLTTDWHFQLDADEVLHERSHAEVREFIKTPNRSAIVTRYNFWVDHRHLIPNGYCCGKYVTRIAPTNLWMSSDGQSAGGEQVASMGVSTGIEIFHYGFIRKNDEFLKKERLLQMYFFNTFDQRLANSEKRGLQWATQPDVQFPVPLDDYHGTHPKCAHQWLKDRNFTL